MFTEKQAKYIERLVSGYVSRAVQIETVDDTNRRKFADAIMAVNLPAPASKAGASAQIDALKGNMSAYAHGNKEWAQSLMQREMPRLEDKMRRVVEVMSFDSQLAAMRAAGTNKLADVEDSLRAKAEAIIRE